jgi:pantoate--beta-alanine ligase
VLATAQQILLGAPALAVDYVAVVDPHTFAPVRPGQAGPAVIVAAVTAGTTRLIDNVPVLLSDPQAADPQTAGPQAKGETRNAADR